MVTDPPKSTIMGSLGAFVGHLVKAVRTNPDERREVARTTEERSDGNVTLRRTTIDEVVYAPGTAPSPPAPQTDTSASDDAAPTDDSQG